MNAKRWVIAAKNKAGQVLFWTGHGWSDAASMAKEYKSAVDALIGMAECKGQPFQADTIVSL